MADIVISHTTEDRDRAEVIARSLSAQGLKVWMYRDILGGGGDRDEVTEKVRNATRVLALWSPAGCASQWVVEEAKMAARDHRLINVELQPGMTPRAFQSGLRIDLSGWSGSRTDPALLPFAEAIATIVTGRVRGAEPEQPEKKSIFGFMKESSGGRSGARSGQKLERATAEQSNMFDVPLEKSSDEKAVPAKPAVSVAGADRVPTQTPAKIQTPSPADFNRAAEFAAAKAAAEAAAAKAAAAAFKTAAETGAVEPASTRIDAPAVSVAATPSVSVAPPPFPERSAPPAPKSDPEIQVFETSKPRTTPEPEEEVHLSLGRAFGYGVVASVVLGLLFLGGRHYFNTRPLTVAAAQIEPAAETPAPVQVEGFRSDDPLVKLEGEIDTQTKSIASVQFGSDEWLLAIAGAESSVRTYVASTAKFFQNWSGDEKSATDVGFNSKAELMAISSVGGNITVWRLANGDKRIINIGTAPVRALAWRPDTNYIATGSDDGLLDIRLVGGTAAPVQHKFVNPITSIAWRQDGAALAVGLKSGGVTFIDARTGKVAYTAAGHAGAVNAVAFSPDGNILGTVGDDGVARMWSADDGHALGEIMLNPCTPAQLTKDGKCPALDVIFSPDASQIMAGGQNGVAESFEVKTKERSFMLQGHKAPITGLAWSNYDRRMVTADRDGKAAFWSPPGNY